MHHDPIDTSPTPQTTEQDACARLGQLSTLFGDAQQAAAHTARRQPAMLPHQMAQLADILAQMRRQAQRLRACQLGLRLLQGGRAPQGRF